MRARTDVDGIIWDLDGTLVDSLPGSIAAYAATMVTLTGREPSQKTLTHALRLGPPSAILGDLLERGCQQSDLEVFHSQLLSHVDRVRPFPGITAALSVLKEKHRLALFSGTDRASVEMLLDGCGLSGFFEAIVTGDDVDEVKPHPAGILAACDRLGLPPDKVAYVGDAPSDLEAAHRAGVIGLHAVWGHRPSQKARDDAVAKTPADVVQHFG